MLGAPTGQTILQPDMPATKVPKVIASCQAFQLFPYLITVSKTQNPNGDKVALSLKAENQDKQILNSAQVQQKVKEVQTYSLFMSDIKKLSPGQRVSIDIWDQKKKSDSNVPRYTIIICDSPDSRILGQVTTKALLISPHV